MWKALAAGTTERWLPNSEVGSVGARRLWNSSAQATPQCTIGASDPSLIVRRMSASGTAAAETNISAQNRST
jgi:hypothetical protein